MKKIFLAAVALASLVAGPALTHAQMFAYVDAAGDVRTIDTTDATTALNTAPNIHNRSGVMVLDSSADQEVVGDDVPVN